MKRICLALLALAVLGPMQAAAQDKLVVSVWGGSWRDMVANIIAKKFTAETGIAVEYITGGTIDRLNKEKLAKGNPESDITFTTSHVGWLYANDGLYEQLDLAKVPNARNLVAQARDQSLSHRHVGLCLHHRIPPRSHEGRSFGSWADLWKPRSRASSPRPTSIRATSSSSRQSCRAAMRQRGKKARSSSRRSSRASRRSTPMTPTASSSSPTARRRCR